ncbi:MAG: ATP-binding protein [Melioribacteraceae bacterium]|nr:ATP-binding protein [Melioribacteraceae bacterium]
MLRSLNNNYSLGKDILPALFFYNLLLIGGILYLISPSMSNTVIIILYMAFSSYAIVLYRGNLKVKTLNSADEELQKITSLNVRELKEYVLPDNLKSLEPLVEKLSSKIQSDKNLINKLESARREFLDNVSHELRTPMFAVQGYLETILKNTVKDPKVRNHFLEKALKHSYKLNDILNNLIDISMLEAGQLKVHEERFYLYDLVDEIKSKFQPEVDSKKINLNVVGCRGELEVFADQEKLKHVFIHLLKNSISHTEKGGVTIFIEEKKNNYVEISVIDTGIGIDENDVSRIFERFYRSERDRENNVKGTGMGLAVVKHIVEAHGSKIQVISKENEGTEFKFRIKKYVDFEKALNHRKSPISTYN